MRRFFRTFAVVAAVASLAGGAALARDHGDGGRRGGGHEERGGRGSEGRGGPPPWAHGGGGRWERPPTEAYGPPPGAYSGPPTGYYQPRRGGYLPPQARGGVVQDYGRYRLRQPPRGYAWVRSGRAMMLMDMNTGQVFDVIPD